MDGKKPRGTCMSISNIIKVDMAELETDRYSYTVAVKEACTGQIKVCISYQNNTDAQYRLNVQSQWYDIAGEAIIEKSLLNDKTDLYIYLLNEDTDENSAIVKVYFEPLSISRLTISQEGFLTVFPDQGDARQNSSAILFQYADDAGIQITYPLALPCTAVRLSEFNVWKDTPIFGFRMRYYMKNQNAEVFGSLSEEVTLYLAPPVITSATMEKEKLFVTGRFTEGVKVNAVIFYQGVPSFSGTLSADGSLDVSSVRFEADGFYTLVASYQGRYCSSYSSVPIPLVPGTPKVTGCTYCADSAVIQTERDSLYQISYGNVCEEKVGRTFTVPKTTESVTIRMACFSAAGISTGTPVVYKLTSPGFYPLKTENRIFYAWQERPDSICTASDLPVVLRGMFPQAETYSGSYFATCQEQDALILLIKKEIFAVDPPQYAVRDDYRKLLLHYHQENAIVSGLRQALREHLPMQKEDFMFFQYGFASDDGYTDICDGMQLLTEYTLYQNIPDENMHLSGTEQTFADLSGFAGTGMASYQVVSRDGNLRIDPFAHSMNFIVEPPVPMNAGMKLCGGAGMADLLYTGFSRPYMRLVYPAVFTSRNSTGNLEYYKNVCLLTADNLKLLEEATVNLRRGSLSLPGVSYHYFRGRSVIVPRICVLINEKPEWFSLGTTLEDIKKNLGLHSEMPVLKRRHKGSLFPVYYVNDQLPLLQGDCITL